MAELTPQQVEQLQKQLAQVQAEKAQAEKAAAAIEAKAKADLDAANKRLADEVKAATEQKAQELAETQKKLAKAEEDAKRFGEEAKEMEAFMAKVAEKQPEIVPVKGSAKVSYKNLDGKKVEKTVKFKDGISIVRLDGGAVVKSEAFLKVINGEELTDAEKALSPAIVGLSQEDANAWMTELTRKGAGFLIIE